MDVTITSKVTAAYSSSISYEKTTGKKNGTDSDSTSLASSDSSSSFTEPEDSVEISAAGKDYSATIQKLKADAEARTEQLRSLVEKLLMKQTSSFKSILSDEDMIAALQSDDLQVDEETAAQAQKDIADDGYWGYEETSTRMVEFAISISGDDTEMADKLMDAIKEGFSQANKMFGGDDDNIALPEVSKKTLERALEKMEAWKNGEDWRNLPKDSDESEGNGSNLTVSYTKSFSYSSETSISFSTGSTAKTEE